MIKGIGLENFKAFKEQAYIDFKKINVFLGPNSSGKSSYLKGLLTLKNTMSNQEAEPALHLSERIGDFTSLVYGNDPDGKITYTIHFDKGKGEPAKDGEDGEFHHKYSISAFTPVFLLSLHTTKGKLDIDKRALAMANEILKFENKGMDRLEFSVKQESTKTPNKVETLRVYFDDGDVYEVHPNENPQIFYNGVPVTHRLLNPYKFIARFKEQDLWGSPVDELENFSYLALALSFIEQDLKNFSENMIHIEPFRHEPKRSELVTDFNFGSVGSKGANMLTSFIGLTKTKKLQNEINRWMNEFQLAESVEVEELGNNNFSLRVKNKNTGITSNIVDVGVGTSQLLPIIVESVISAPNSVLLIEEPETHIHPNAQAKLAELFVESSQKFDKRFFVETHSMYLVMQLQILAAKKLLKPEEIGIYYFKQDENGTHVIDLQLNEKGQFDVEFPTGFFDVAYEMTKILLRHM